MENSLFVCQCEDVNHQLIVSYDPDPIFDDIIFVHIHLTDTGFWNRIKYAFQYVIGKRSRFGAGAWAEVLLDKKRTFDLITTLQKHYEEMK